ncbi:MAG: DUF6998 domain-containing protein [Planctomycetota bacterium]|jgi:hypothetical protein
MRDSLDMKKFWNIIRKIFKLTDELEKMTGRAFTPDGHFVGSCGEVLAREVYGVNLLKPSTKGRDGKKNGRNVEVKATFHKTIGISSVPEKLLVLELSREGDFREVFNGPGSVIENLFNKKRESKEAGQIQITLPQLRVLQKKVKGKGRIMRKQPGGKS